MESVDKLRDYASRNQRVSGWMTALNRIADEIESEIAEHYTKLPVDADGVPIRLGDIMERVDGGPSQQACCICPQGFNDAPIWCARDFRHVKPDPLKELLSELADEVWETSCTCQTTWSDSGLDGIEERYAERIRELLGGDAE